MTNLHNKITLIEKEIDIYYETSFDNDREDYEFNKTLKEKLKTIIIQAKGNDTKRKAIFVLATHTGCAEDLEIAEQIINHLQDNKHITTEIVDYFYDNLNTGRWH